MKKKIVFIFILLMSVFLIGCSGDLKISINLEEGGDLSFSITIDDLETIRNNTQFKSREDIEAYLKELFPFISFVEKENFKKEITYNHTTTFTSLEDLKNKLSDIKISGKLSLFKDIEISDDTAEGLFLGFTVEKLVNNQILDLDTNIVDLLSLNIKIEMPFDIAQYTGGELKDSKTLSVKLNRLSKENEIYVYCDEIDSIETAQINIVVDKKEGGNFNWYISEVLEKEEEATLLAESWGFNKYEAQDKELLYFNKGQSLVSYDVLSNFVKKITKNANPQSQDIIFNDFSISGDSDYIELKGEINQLKYKNNVKINIFMPGDIIESRGGFLEDDNFYTCIIKEMKTPEIYIKADLNNKINKTNITSMVVISAIVIFNLMLFIIVLKEVKKDKKKSDK